MKEPDPFLAIAERAHFNIYFSDLWQGTGRRFAEYVVEHCAQLCASQADRRNIRHAFGLPVENPVKYPAPEVSGSVNSQYEREYNLPRKANPTDAEHTESN